MPWIAIGSIRVWPTVKRGFRLAYGFWNTIWMRRRIASISRLGQRQQVDAVEDHLPPTGPPLGSCSRSSVRPIVVLPEPDSPTTPSVWPCAVEARALDRLELLRPNTPLRSQKLLVSARPR